MRNISLNSIVLVFALFPFTPNLLGFIDIEPYCLILCFFLLVFRFAEIKILPLDIFWILAASLATISSLPSNDLLIYEPSLVG